MRSKEEIEEKLDQVRYTHGVLSIMLHEEIQKEENKEPSERDKLLMATGAIGAMEWVLGILAQEG